MHAIKAFDGRKAGSLQGKLATCLLIAFVLICMACLIFRWTGMRYASHRLEMLRKAIGCIAESQPCQEFRFKFDAVIPHDTIKSGYTIIGSSDFFSYTDCSVRFGDGSIYSFDMHRCDDGIYEMNICRVCDAP